MKNGPIARLSRMPVLIFFSQKRLFFIDSLFSPRNLISPPFFAVTNTLCPLSLFSSLPRLSSQFPRPTRSFCIRVLSALQKSVQIGSIFCLFSSPVSREVFYPSCLSRVIPRFLSRATRYIRGTNFSQLVTLYCLHYPAANNCRPPFLLTYRSRSFPFSPPSRNCDLPRNTPPLFYFPSPPLACRRLNIPLPCLSL